MTTREPPRDDQSGDDEPPPHLPSEPALAEDWNREEEDAAWAHLQPEESRPPVSGSDIPGGVILRARGA